MDGVQNYETTLKSTTNFEDEISAIMILNGISFLVIFPKFFPGHPVCWELADPVI